MLEQLKSYPLFNGYRGKPKMPLDDVSEMIEAFSNMIQALPSIIEIDLNPITWDQTSNKLLALDCRIKVD
jgi:acetyltransferase